MDYTDSRKRKRDDEQNYEEDDGNINIILEEIDRIEHRACSRVREQIKNINEQTTSQEIKKLQKLSVIVTLCAYALRNVDVRGRIDFDNVDMLFDDGTYSFEYDTEQEGHYWITDTALVVPINAIYSKDEGRTFIKKPMVVKLTLFRNKSKNQFKSFLNEVRILQEIEKRNTENSNFHTCTVLNYGILKFNEYFTIGVNIMSRLQGTYAFQEWSDELYTEVIDKILSAITSMHEEIKLVHNDLHDENFKFDESTRTLQIFDFGMSCFFSYDSEEIQDLKSRGIRVFDCNSDMNKLVINMLKLRDYFYVAFREKDDETVVRFLKHTNFCRKIESECSGVLNKYKCLQESSIVKSEINILTEIQNFMIVTRHELNEDNEYELIGEITNITTHYCDALIGWWEV